MANAQPVTIPTTAKAKKGAKALSLDLSKLVLEAASKRKGAGGGYVGKRTSAEIVPALKAALEAAKIDPTRESDQMDALTVAFSAAAGGGLLAMILEPQQDGTFTHGAAPMAPLSYKGPFPAGAAVYGLPPCGAFQGGLVVMAPHPTKGGMWYWRMVKGELAPKACPFTKKVLAEMVEVEAAQGVSQAMQALGLHLADHRNGGALISAVKGA